MKVKIIETDEILEVPDHFSVKDGHLFNHNTQHFEAVGGDIVTSDGKEYHVLPGQYTEFQIIPCEEGEKESHCIVLSASPARSKLIHHVNHVEKID